MAIFVNIHTHGDTVHHADCEIAIRVVYRDFTQVTRNAQSCCVGLHPYYVQDYTAAEQEEAFQIMHLGHVIAIGEIGLDKRNKIHWGLQQSLLHRQLQIAEQLRKPVVIHCVQV